MKHLDEMISKAIAVEELKRGDGTKTTGTATSAPLDYEVTMELWELMYMIKGFELRQAYNLLKPTWAKYHALKKKAASECNAMWRCILTEYPNNEWYDAKEEDALEGMQAFAANQIRYYQEIVAKRDAQDYAAGDEPEELDTTGLSRRAIANLKRSQAATERFDSERHDPTTAVDYYHPDDHDALTNLVQYTEQDEDQAGIEVLAEFMVAGRHATVEQKVDRDWWDNDI